MPTAELTRGLDQKADPRLILALDVPARADAESMV